MERPDLPPYLARLRTVGDHLRQHRINSELLQREVAELIGVGKWTIVLWENNRAEPLVHHYPKIIEFLGYDPTPEPATLSQRILSARRRLGLNQEQFAGILGIDPKTVWRWEQDEHQPSGTLRGKLLKILDEVEGDRARDS